MGPQYPGQPGQPPGPPHGYGYPGHPGQPPYPPQPPQQPYYPQPAAAPGARGVDVRVSYGARMGCAIAAAVPCLLIALWALIAPLVTGATPSDDGHCKSPLRGTVACAGRAATKAGTNYDFDVPTSGTYTVKVVATSPDAPELELQLMDAADDGLLEYDLGQKPGSTGNARTVSRKLSAGNYRVHVEELSPTAKGTPFSLAITRLEGPTKKAEDSSSTEVNPIVIAFGLLGLTFLLIPLVLTGEKKRIPRRIDPTGITMRNGVVLPWSEYRGIRPIIHVRPKTGHRWEAGVEILFARGSAQILNRPIRNMHEIAPILASLNQGMNPFP